MSVKNEIHTCRICLEVGNIPIYHGSYTDYNLCENICLIGDVEVREDDLYPKHLCKPCFTVLLSAVEFRRTAKESDQSLRGRLSASPATDHDYYACEENYSKLISEPLREQQSVPKSIDSTQLSLDIINTECYESELQTNCSLTKNGDIKESVRPIKYDSTATEKQMICKICNQTVVRKFWDYHFLIHQQSVSCKTKCEICHYEVPNATALFVHIQNEHSNKHINKSKSSNKLIEEQNDHVNINEIKREPFFDNNSLVPSMYSKYFEPTSDKNRAKCIICNKIVQTGSRREHYILHDANAANRFECNICNKSFRHKNSYRTHKCLESTNLNHKKFKKNPTEKISKYYKQVMIHNELMAQCQICGQTLKKIYFNRHYNLKHSQKRNSTTCLCEECGMGFAFRSQLNNHKVTHYQEFVYKCKLCPYKGRQQGLLKSHMRMHNAKVYQCDICSKKCVLRNNLIRHIRRHNKPDHECDICKKNFYEKSVLDRHIKETHCNQKKSHPCDKCDKVYIIRKNLLIHQSKVHGRIKTGAGYARAHYRKLDPQTC